MQSSYLRILIAYLIWQFSFFEGMEETDSDDLTLDAVVERLIQVRDEGRKRVIELKKLEIANMRNQYVNLIF